MSFDGKVAIITGAGGGLGKEHALILASQGAKVLVNDLGGSVDGSGQSDAADAVVEEIRAAGGTAVANKNSVSERAGAKAIVEAAVSEFGTVDILINNAGILRDKTFKKMTLDEWDAVINVHLNGSAYVTWHAWPIMYEKNYGRILFTSSVSGILGSFGQANYGAAKMGMVGLMNNLSREGASHNVRVNCLSPGAETRMTASVPGQDMNADDPQPDNHPKLVSPAAIYMVSEDAPNGRIMQAAQGRFASDHVYANQGMNLGLEATWEDVAEHADEILGLDSMAAKTTFWRDED
jgi:NAD(P)-dependent dehydrogenase (short-subunit alcohol dehydrogenase family)